MQTRTTSAPLALTSRLISSRPYRANSSVAIRIHRSFATLIGDVAYMQNFGARLRSSRWHAPCLALREEGSYENLDRLFRVAARRSGAPARHAELHVRR